MLLKLSADYLLKFSSTKLGKASPSVAPDISNAPVWKRLLFSLFPTGRAFLFPRGGTASAVIGVLADYYALIDGEAKKVLTSLTPLNEDFDIEDVRLWEPRLWILSGEGLPIENRKAVILRKMRHPGTQVDRAHYLWLQKMVQESGFPTAYVHENRFGGPVYAPIDPQYYLNLDAKICATYLDQDTDDDNFTVTSDPTRWANCVFIGGEVFGGYINIPQSRYPAFRQTILSVKPAHVCAILLVKLLPY